MRSSASLVVLLVTFGGCGGQPPVGPDELVTAAVEAEPARAFYTVQTAGCDARFPPLTAGQIASDDGGHSFTLAPVEVAPALP